MVKPVSGKVTIQLIVLLLFISCSGQTVPVSGDAASKITFSLDEIDENGLIGTEDNKRMIAYKFRIDVNRKHKREIHRIDPSIKFFPKPDGKTYQCIGEGATKEKLLRLASLPYIFRIDPFYGE